ncbi:MAG: cation diffusion facilitator family transporter [Bacteroidota bacterium]
MGHRHHHTSSDNLRLAFFLNLGFTVLEFIGGLYVNSIAIISDAVHDLGDSLSLGTSWYLERKSKKRANTQFSYGYKRFSLLGALINSLVLIGGSIYVVYEAVGRILEPEYSDAQGMMVFAIIGVLVNGYAAWKVSKGKTMNEKVVSWHLLEDVLGWVAVLIVAIVLYFYDNPYLDPALSLLITLYILYNVVRRLRETLYLFLQGVPKEIDLEGIKSEILKMERVASLHNTHIWSQEGENHVFTTHVRLTNVKTIDQIIAVKEAIKNLLEGYHFQHCTVETELEKEHCSLREKQERVLNPS